MDAMTPYPFLVVAAFLAILNISAHGGAPLPPLPLLPAAREFLDAHNQARSDVGVPALMWSDDIASAASRLAGFQRDILGCDFANLTNLKYGGNQVQAFGHDLPPSAAVDSWVRERAYYDHDNNTCLDNHMCGVYTQVVWRNTTELGCAQVYCSDKTQSLSLTLCFYNPPGNIEGESPY